MGRREVEEARANGGVELGGRKGGSEGDGRLKGHEHGSGGGRVHAFAPVPPRQTLQLKNHSFPLSSRVLMPSFCRLPATRRDMPEQETQDPPRDFVRLPGLLQADKGMAHLFAQTGGHCCRAGPQRKGVVIVSYAATSSSTSARVVLVLVLVLLVLVLMMMMAVWRRGKSIPKPLHHFLVLSIFVSALLVRSGRWSRQDKRAAQGVLQLGAPSSKGERRRRGGGQGRRRAGLRRQGPVVALSKEAGELAVEGERIRLAGCALLSLRCLLLLHHHHHPREGGGDDWRRPRMPRPATRDGA